MTQNATESISVRKALIPGYIYVDNFLPEGAEAVIARIREVAAEIIAERDVELVEAVVASWSKDDSGYSPRAVRNTLNAIRAAGFSITKDGATS